MTVYSAALCLLYAARLRHSQLMPQQDFSHKNEVMRLLTVLQASTIALKPLQWLDEPT